MKIKLHPDFKEFLSLLNKHDARYLIVGGYAVAFYGYPRATGDMDIWIERSEENVLRLLSVYKDFGVEGLDKNMFLEKNKVLRLGIPPVRLEILTEISGVNFRECYSQREIVKIDGVPMNIIALEDLKKNKKEAGRYKDMDDLEHLP